MHGGTGDFLYLSWRPKDWRPGGPEVSHSTWLRRMKVRLGSITWPQIEQAARENGLLEIKVAGTDGYAPVKRGRVRCAHRCPTALDPRVGFTSGRPSAENIPKRPFQQPALVRSKSVPSTSRPRWLFPFLQEGLYLGGAVVVAFLELAGILRVKLASV